MLGITDAWIIWSQVGILFPGLRFHESACKENTMPLHETIELTKLRQAQQALHQLVAAGFDFDGGYRAAIADLDQVIVRLVASRWRGVANDPGTLAAARSFASAA